jgi:hypothetical protein
LCRESRIACTRASTLNVHHFSFLIATSSLDLTYA